VSQLSELMRFYAALKAEVLRHKPTPETRDRFIRAVAGRSGLPVERVLPLTARLKELVKEAETESVIALLLRDAGAKSRPLVG